MQTLGLPLMLALTVPIHISGPLPDCVDCKTFSIAAARNHLRPLLLFAPHGSDPLLLRQLDLLRSSDLLERDMVIVTLPVQGDPPPPDKLDGSVFATLPLNERTAVRQQFHIEPSVFTLVLLGKDGGEKLRSNSPVPMSFLNQLIDAMPMRQHEIQARH